MYIPFSDYRSLPGINASLLKACANGLWSGWQSLHIEREPSDAMKFGTALHAYFLEADRFGDLVAVSQKFDRRTKAGKEASEAFEAQANGKTVISEEELEQIKRMHRRAAEILEFSSLLGTGLKEFTISGDMPSGRIKGRLDLMSKDGSVIVDIKTTRSADPALFAKDFLNLHYDVQFLHYANLARIHNPKLASVPKMLVLACETGSGEVALYDVTDISTREKAVEKYWRAFDTALELERTPECPDKFPRFAVTLNAPSWA
jgi:hypothetical protein